MAKAKKMELPTVDEEVTPEVTPEVTEESSSEQVAPPATISTQIRSVSVPMANVRFGYLPRQIYLRKLTTRQSGALRQLQEALCSQGVRLADGSQIRNPANAIKWLLESVAAT